MAEDNHPVIILWAHPRSMSTALERVMRERGDCHCLHEPFMYYYYLHKGVREMPHFEARPDQPTTFTDIVAMMRERSRDQTVFSKDMAYYVLPEIFSSPELASTFRHAFLVRDPRRALMSYYRLDPDFLSDEAGLEAQWKLFRWITEQTGETPPVVRAEDIQRDTRGMMAALWERLDLPFVESAFSWQAGTQPADWQQVGTWHERTSRHGGIATDERSDAEIQSAFDAMCLDAPVLADYFRHHWPYYLELSAHALEA